MRTDRLSQFRNWPSAAYTEQLVRVWRASNAPRSGRVLDFPPPDTAGRPRRLAVVAHVYYADLLDELRTTVRNLPGTADLFLSVVDEAALVRTRACFADWSHGDVDIRIVENRGRDIAPKYVAFRDVYPRGHELILFLHTKKSTHAEVGAEWRHFLFSTLAGSPDRVAQVLALFDEHPRLGVLAPGHLEFIRPYIGWHGNYGLARRVARRMEVEVRRWDPPEFPSGSMFWARPAALAPIGALRLRQRDFPPEAKQIANTVMHALERLVFVAADRAGYESAFISADGEVRSAVPADEVGGEVRRRTAPRLRTRLAAVPPTARTMGFDVGLRIARARRVLRSIAGSARAAGR